jgi:hypothetical protein
MFQTKLWEIWWTRMWRGKSNASTYAIPARITLSGSICRLESVFWSEQTSYQAPGMQSKWRRRHPARAAPHLQRSMRAMGAASRTPPPLFSSRTDASRCQISPPASSFRLRSCRLTSPTLRRWPGATQSGAGAASLAARGAPAAPEARGRDAEEAPWRRVTAGLIPLHQVRPHPSTGFYRAGG